MARENGDGDSEGDSEGDGERAAGSLRREGRPAFNGATAIGYRRRQGQPAFEGGKGRRLVEKKKKEPGEKVVAGAPGGVLRH